MKIIYLASGAANMYCGSCLHDNALVAGMKAAGEDVSLFPFYSPMRLDEESVGERQIFHGNQSLLKVNPEISVSSCTSRCNGSVSCTSSSAFCRSW